MEKLNQLFFIVFALFLFGIYLSTVKSSSIERNKYITWYWPMALVSRAFAFLTWAIVPYLGNKILVVPNTLYIISFAFLLLTFRSWRVSISKKLHLCFFAFSLLYAIVYLILFHHFDGFIYRVWLFTICMFLISVLEFYEILKNARQDKSPLLRLILALAVIQFGMAVFAIKIIMETAKPETQSILQGSAESMIGFWLTFGAHLIFFIVVNSFLYQKLWESEKKAHDQLKESRLKVTSVTKEKEEIAGLLQERDALVGQLLRANKTVATGALSASIAHEINQPLTVIQMNIQLLRELVSVQGKAVDLKMQTELIEEILKNNQRASNIVKSLRAIFSERPQDFERVDVVQIIRSVLDIGKSELNLKKITVELKLPASAFANIYPQEILQIILNLLNNAITSLSDSTQSEKQITVELKCKDDQIQICVSDNGPGVSKANEAQLFELLADTKHTGMGLGLWLCKYVIGRHDGLIWHEPIATGGAKFCVRFPTNLVSYKISN